MCRRGGGVNVYIIISQCMEKCVLRKRKRGAPTLWRICEDVFFHGRDSLNVAFIVQRLSPVAMGDLILQVHAQYYTMVLNLYTYRISVSVRHTNALRGLYTGNVVILGPGHVCVLVNFTLFQIINDAIYDGRKSDWCIILLLHTYKRMCV